MEGRENGVDAKKRIVAAGHICLDITPIFPGETEKRVEKILTPGRLIHMKGVDIHTGGSAANTGLALQFMGADVRILGKIGMDNFGEIIRGTLKKYGVTKGLIQDGNCGTSYSMILAIPGIDRIFLHDPGANDTYGPEDIPEEELEGIDLFHFGYPPLMKRMYQGRGEELERILRRVKEKHIPISLDMAAVDEESPAGNADWIGILKNILPLVDIFLPSIEELLFMADRERYKDIQTRAAGRDITQVLNIREDVMPLANKMLEWGAGIVLIKCGSAGLYLACADRERLRDLQTSAGIDTEKWEKKALFEASYKPACVCSGTGAGDTCIAAFLMGVLLKKTPEECAKLAAAQGASCVEAYDALGGLRTIEELEARIARGWEKNAAIYENIS